MYKLLVIGANSKIGPPAWPGMGMISGWSVGLTRPKSGGGVCLEIVVARLARSRRMTEVAMATEIVAPTEVQWQL